MKPKSFILLLPFLFLFSNCYKPRSTQDTPITATEINTNKLPYKFNVIRKFEGTPQPYREFRSFDLDNDRISELLTI
jgi:hypothetical protein